MRDDQNFNIEFVKTVEQYPVIYNYTLEEYSSKQDTELAWELLGATFKESGSACREKWKILRGGYTRYLKKKNQRAAGSGSMKPYYLTKYMEFLQPYLKSKCSGKASKQKPRTMLSDKDETSELADTDDTSSMTRKEKNLTVDNQWPKSNLHRQEKRRMSDSVDKDGFECVERKRRKKRGDLENADLQFLRSLLPDMELLPRQKKNVFKIEVLRLLNKLLTNQATYSTTCGGTEQRSRSRWSSDSSSCTEVPTPLYKTTKNSPPSV